MGNVSKGPPIGIVSLNKVGPHAILGGGTGKFIVSGTIFLNTDVTDQPWTSSSAGDEWDDGIDAKTNSNLYVYGTIDTVNTTYLGEALWPLDHCFQGDGLQPTGTGTTPTAPGGALPNVKLSCAVTNGTVTVDYNDIDNTFPQITDPLGGVRRAGQPLRHEHRLPGPHGADQPAPAGGRRGRGAAPRRVHEAGGDHGVRQLPGLLGIRRRRGAYPGLYRFDDGLWINPGAGANVTGSNVVLATQSPYPVAGNVPGSGSGAAFATSGSGNGAPCLTAGTMTSDASGSGGSPESEVSSTACGGTSPTTYGVLAYHDTPVTNTPDSSMTGTGNNFSLMIGGASSATVNLAGPTTGPYAGVDGSPGIVFYQDPGTQANYGFDAEAGDAAAITLTGVVYNASLTNYGTSAPQDYWDGEGGGIPFYAGGTLQTGFGAGWSNGPTQSVGLGDDQRHRHRRRLQYRREHRHHHPRPALPGARRQQPVTHRMRTVRAVLSHAR